MYFSNLIIAAASLASVAVAQTDSTGGKGNMITNVGITDKTLQAGQTYTVEWTDNQGSEVTVKIRHGDPNALDQGVVVCDKVANSGKCTFTVPKNSENDNKNTIEICQGSSTTNCNYSPMFQVSGGTGKAAASASGTAATATGDNATATESSEPSASMSGAPTAAETITGTSTPSTLQTTKSSYDTESALPTETDATATTTSSKAKSTGTSGNAPSPNEGSVARSSSLAMALCIFAAVAYLG